MTERLLLVGMMAVGKTTVGQLCAKRLGWSFLDSDAQLLSDTGRSAQEIFDADGDEALRILESRALVEAVARREPVVVSVAGGAVLSESNRSLLTRSGVVVWLRASIETLSERVRRGGARPRLGDDPTQSLRDLYETRHPLYAAVADFVIDVDDLAPDEVVARVLAETGLGESDG
ncbi:MAG: shikimate kinase [Acidimicrobiales bacterium]|jgi:shikimate kinase